MKTIGLVGGMTPESTSIYYKLLIRGARQPGGKERRGETRRHAQLVQRQIHLGQLDGPPRAERFHHRIGLGLWGRDQEQRKQAQHHHRIPPHR